MEIEFSDLLPLLGVALGWLLSEVSAWGKRSLQKKKDLGHAISVLYYLNLEMVQIKMAHERFKNGSSDTEDWEQYRTKSFEKYANNSPEFRERVRQAIDAVAEFYPVKGYHLREIVHKYEFLKSKSLESFTQYPVLYVTLLSGHETGFIGYQHKLERILCSIAFRHALMTWVRIRLHFRHIRKQVSDDDIVFFDQIRK